MTVHDGAPNGVLVLTCSAAHRLRIARRAVYTVVCRKYGS
jgi:hypothetical protein